MESYFIYTQSLNKIFKPQHIVDLDFFLQILDFLKNSLCVKVLLLGVWFPSLKQFLETLKCIVSGPISILLSQNLYS